MNANQNTPPPSGLTGVGKRQASVPTNRPPLPQGEGWGEGEKLEYPPLSVSPLPQGCNRPPLPQGEGWGEGEKYEYLPLSAPLRERARAPAPYSIRGLTGVGKSGQTSMTDPLSLRVVDAPRREGWGEGEKYEYLPLSAPSTSRLQPTPSPSGRGLG